MIRSSACQPQADPSPALSGRHGDRQSYTTPGDTIARRRASFAPLIELRRKPRHNKNLLIDELGSDIQMKLEWPGYRMPMIRSYKRGVLCYQNDEKPPHLSQSKDER